MRFFCTQNDLSPLNLAALIIKAMRIVDEIKKCSGLEKKEIVCSSVIMMLREFDYEGVALTGHDIDQMIQAIFHSNILKPKKWCC
jgi:hypothetical protein